MALIYTPRIGNLLMCDFSEGFKEPEMVKDRPVIVLSTGGRHRNDLVTVVPLSTTEPSPVESHHLEIDKKMLPQLGYFQNASNGTWVKGDMVYTVGYKRLRPISLGRDKVTNKRIYYRNSFGRKTMKEVYSCVLHGLNIGDLAQYL